MIEWPLTTVPLLKALHITTLVLWCGGLLALPMMLSHHDPAVSQDDYRRVRRAAHLTYTMCVTPAALIAVVSGTWLIFFRQAFVPWLYAKLVFVALLVAAHAWIGHILVKTAEKPGRHRPPEFYVPMTVVLVPVLAILVLVLGKPDLSWIPLPDLITEPRGGQLFFEVPRR